MIVGFLIGVVAGGLLEHFVVHKYEHLVFEYYVKLRGYFK